MSDRETIQQRPENGASLVARSGSMDWQSDGDGFWYKPLFEDPSTGMKTWLMRVEAGAEAAMHAHEDLEQVYVLEGEFYDSEHTYGPGDFIVRGPGAMHTGGSRGGATVLLVYSG